MKRIIVVIALAMLSVWSCPVAMAGVTGQIEYENEWDEDSNHEGAVEANIRYKSKPWYLQLEFEKPIQPDSKDGHVELQGQYNWKIGKKGKFSVLNEITYSLDKESWSAELTPRFYWKLPHGFQIGFDLEIDYLTNDEWEINEIEIEPTIKWGTKVGPGKLGLELEAPTTRLYSSSDTKDDFEAEEILPIITYKLPLNDHFLLFFEFGAPYDLVDSEWETYLNVALRWSLPTK